MQLIGWQFNSKLVCQKSLIVMTYELLSIICVYFNFYFYFYFFAYWLYEVALNKYNKLESW